MGKTLEDLLKEEGFDTENPESQKSTRSGMTLDELMAEEQAVPVDTSPIEIDRTVRPKTSVFSQLPVPSEFERQEDDPMVVAASAGVDFRTGAPGGHFVAGFAIDEENERLAYSQALNANSNTVVRTRVGPQTGKIEYLNPQTQRWTLVNPLGPGKEDMKRSVGPVITMGLEGLFVAGAVGVGAVSGGAGSVALFAAGTASSAVLAESVRLWMGHEMGVNQNVSVTDVGAHLATIGAIGAGAGLAGEAGVRTGIAFYKWLGLDVSTRQLVREFGMDLGEAIRLQEAINRKVVGAEFQFRLGQASNVEDILAVEKMMEKNVVTSQMMNEGRNKQMNALRAYFDLINEPYITASRGSKYAAGKGIKEAAGKPVMAGTREADLLVDVKEAELTRLVDSLHDAPGENLGTPLRGFLQKQTDELDQWADDVVDEFSAAVGDSVVVRPTQTAELLASLDKKARDALLPHQKKELVSIIGDREVAQVDGDPRMVMDEGGLFRWEEQADEVVLGLRNPDSDLSVDQIWNALKSLKRMQRRAGSPGSEPMDTAVLNQLIDSLQTDLRVALRQADPTLEHTYDQFITKYATETNRLKRGVIGEIMDVNPQTKRPYIEDPRVFDQLFAKQRGLVDPAQQLHDSINMNPELMQRTREAMARHWKDTVFASGKFNARAQKKWLDDYGPAARLFMNDDEMKAIIQVGDVVGEIEKRVALRKSMYDEINASFEGQIYNRGNASLLLNDMMVKGEHEFAEKTMQILRKYGDDETIRMVRDATRRRVVKDLTLPRGPDGYEFSRDAFNKLLYGEESYLENLRVIMGDQYVDDLMVIGDSFRMMSRESTSQFNPSGTAAVSANRAIMDLTRAYVGLFTRAGRVVTAANRIRGRAANQLLVNALANPGDLRTLVSLAEVKPFDPRWVRYLGSVGATGLLLSENEAPTTGPIEFPEDE